MARTGKILLAVCTFAAAMLATAAPAGAAPAGPTCQVRNATTGGSYGSTSGAALTDAIAAAGAGDRLVIAGTCTGTYTVEKNLTLAGRHHGARRAVLDGGHAGTVLLVGLEATVTVTDLVLTHGRGGLANFGNLTVIRTAVTANVMPEGPGGGVLNSNVLTLTRSTVTDNRAFSEGGGIDNTGTGSLVTWKTTIAGNTAGGSGGGILNDGLAQLHRSLVTRNSAGLFGGGIYTLFSPDGLILDRTRVIANQPDDCAC